MVYCCYPINVLNRAVEMKSAFVSIVGRPSSGKSTLLNSICGHKVSIVAEAPQTTRNAVRGIHTTGNTQLVFVDTPGYHTSERTFNKHMIKLITESFVDVDLVLYLIDSSRSPGIEEEALRNLVTPLADRLIVGLNKSDLGATTRIHVDALNGLVSADRILTLSALNGDGIDRLLALLTSLAPEGEHYYPSEFYTDQDPEFRATEIIREKAINRVREEIPHAIYVEIADMELRDETLWIRAFLLVERESQLGIVVGKKGSGVRAIRKAAVRDLSELFPYRIDLDLRVKVSKDWRKKDFLLKKLIR